MEVFHVMSILYSCFIKWARPISLSLFCKSLPIYFHIFLPPVFYISSVSISFQFSIRISIRRVQELLWREPSPSLTSNLLPPWEVNSSKTPRIPQTYTNDGGGDDEDNQDDQDDYEQDDKYDNDCGDLDEEGEVFGKFWRPPTKIAHLICTQNWGFRQ